ncbi:MAG: hypothetical protein HYV04_09165 [Deltaproteobacteria bacterium]|nr:hypothetical protein [Deltaproteobacteria bacterium]
MLLGTFFTTVILSPPILTAAEAPIEAAPPVQAEPSPGEDLGYGVGAVLASVLYSPLKITYAGLGLLTGGAGYLLSAGSPEVANAIINPAVRGDYIIKPNHLKGTEPVIFIGPTLTNSYPPTTPPPAPAAQP